MRGTLQCLQSDAAYLVIEARNQHGRGCGPVASSSTTTQVQRVCVWMHDDLQNSSPLSAVSSSSPFGGRRRVELRHVPLEKSIKGGGGEVRLTGRRGEPLHQRRRNTAYNTASHPTERLVEHSPHPPGERTPAVLARDRCRVLWEGKRTSQSGPWFPTRRRAVDWKWRPSRQSTKGIYPMCSVSVSGSGLARSWRAQNGPMCGAMRSGL